VAGGVITLTAPASGASAVLGGSSAVIGSDGKASVTATANGTVGTYTVIGSASGIASPANFSLTNTAPAALLASSPLPQQISDRTWAELGQSWDLLLAGSNVQMLKNDSLSSSS
jgi:hypothetical protein